MHPPIFFLRYSPDEFGIFTIIILFLNGSTETAVVMDALKAFKHSAEVREYWRLEKRKQRAEAKVAKGAITEQSEKICGRERSVRA